MTISMLKCSRNQLQTIIKRCVGQSVRKSVVKSTNKETDNEVKANPFESIPGPKGPLRIGSILNYSRFIGKYSWDRLDEGGKSKYQEYGKIVRESMLPGVNIVWLFDPDDIACVLNDFGSGGYPQRTSHLALQKFRQNRPKIYASGGLLPTNGEDWWRMRSEFQKGLSSPKAVRCMLPDSEQIVREWIRHLNVPASSFVLLDMLPELSRLNLELVSHLAFDVRLNGFTAEERQPTSMTSRLMEAAETTNNCILPTDNGLQLWRYFETPVYRKLKEAQEFMESVAIDLVNKKVSRFKKATTCSDTFRGRSVLEEYLSNPKLDCLDIVVMATDFLLAGIDTTSYTSSFLLYHVATNKEVQQRLFQEACHLLPDAVGHLDEEQLNSGAPYARAVLKESLRLNPISIGVGRTLCSDTVLSGYAVPKGTMIVTQNMVACRLAQNFENPEAFIPERWIRGHPKRVVVNPYLVLPFGHGMRACIARRLAEQSMLLMIINLIRQFEITWCGASSMGIQTRLINRPDQPVLIQLKRRQ